MVGALDRLLERASRGETLILDGATGTELERHGAASELPLWSARALLEDPGLVARIHADYVAAGADLLTANTFRTQRRTVGEPAAELTRLALELAREAASASPRDVAVLGSAPPLEDCFRPDLAPDDAVLRREHDEHAVNLARGGADAVLVETMNTLREARAAGDAAGNAGLPALVSFVCWDGARLLSGEPLAEALEAVRETGARTVGVNCLPPSNVAPCLAALTSCGLPCAVYPNLGEPLDEAGARRSEECSPETFAALAQGWVGAGVQLVGGCCGTTPRHTAALAQHLRS